MSDPIKIYKINGAWVDEPFYSMGSAEMVLLEDHRKEMRKMASLLKNAADAIELIPGGSVMRRVVSEIRAALTELRKQQMAHEGITQQDIAETMPE